MLMRKMLPVVGFLFMAGVVMTLVGCVEAEQTYVVYPDGSGKICVSVKMMMPIPEEMLKDQLAEIKKKAFKESPFKNYTGIYFDPAAVKADIVDGKLRQYMEFVFEDINKITDQDGKPLGVLTALEEGGYKLTITPPSEMSKMDMPDGGPDADPQMQEMMKQMLKGLKVVTALRMPGDVKTTPLPVKEGRVTSLTVTDEDIFNKEKRDATVALLKSFEVVCGAVTDAKVKEEHETFKKQLPATIEASKKFLEEMKAEEAEDEGGEDTDEGGGEEEEEEDEDETPPEKG